MQEILTYLLQIIKMQPTKQLIIAIDGRCASGKTTLANQLQEALACNVIHMDHFFLQPEQRTDARMKEAGGNVDYERVLKEVMLPLKQGQTIIYRPFNCKTKSKASPIRLEPKQVTIIEGSYSCHPTLWSFYHLRIFLTISPKEQLKRIAQRNGIQAVTVFRDTWIPLEEQYFLAYEIQKRCDLTFESPII